MHQHLDDRHHPIVVLRRGFDQLHAELGELVAKPRRAWAVAHGADDHLLAAKRVDAGAKHGVGAQDLSAAGCFHRVADIPLQAVDVAEQRVLSDEGPEPVGYLDCAAHRHSQEHRICGPYDRPDVARVPDIRDVDRVSAALKRGPEQLPHLAAPPDDHDPARL